MKKLTQANTLKSIDQRLAMLPQEIRKSLEKLRQSIRAAAPQAEELISYNMPAFRYHGMLVYFDAFKNHCTFFVGNGRLIKKMGDELKSYKTTPSGIHFTVDKPLPMTLVKKIVRLRMRENELKEKAKGKK